MAPVFFLAPATAFGSLHFFSPASHTWPVGHPDFFLATVFLAAAFLAAAFFLEITEIAHLPSAFFCAGTHLPAGFLSIGTHLSSSMFLRTVIHSPLILRYTTGFLPRLAPGCFRITGRVGSRIVARSAGARFLTFFFRGAKGHAQVLALMPRGAGALYTLEWSTARGAHDRLPGCSARVVALFTATPRLAVPLPSGMHTIRAPRDPGAAS